MKRIPTVALTIASDGTPLPTLIIFKSNSKKNSNKIIQYYKIKAFTSR